MDFILGVTALLKSTGSYELALRHRFVVEQLVEMVDKMIDKQVKEGGTQKFLSPLTYTVARSIVRRKVDVCPFSLWHFVFFCRVRWSTG